MDSILYIVHPTFDASELKNSVLIDRQNIDFINNPICHTSLYDLQAEQIIKVSKRFDTIKFIDKNYDIESEFYLETQALLNKLNLNTPPETVFTNLDVRSREQQPTLWVFGCSHSHGVGLDHVGLRYSSIMCELLNMPLKSITQPGSSFSWSTRHLLESDLQVNDIVVWQITTPGRISVFKNNRIYEKAPGTYSRAEVEVYTDEQTFFNHINLLRTGINYLRSKNIKFVLTSIEPHQPFFYQYKLEYTKYREYCYTPNSRIDLGNDELHVGPLSHKNLANSLIDHIQYIYD